MGKDLAKLVFTLTDGFQNNIAPIHSSANFDILILEYLLAQDAIVIIRKSILPFVINRHFHCFGRFYY